MTTAKRASVDQVVQLAARSGGSTSVPRVTLGVALASISRGLSGSRYLFADQAVLLSSGKPTVSRYEFTDLAVELVSRSGGLKGSYPLIDQTALLVSYKSTAPDTLEQSAWTFIMDGHRFYVLPLGQEGTWAYDTTTREWCQLQSQGFNGLNFTHGVMWGMRVMGGDNSYTYLYEMDPTQPNDETWREVQHMVTGGIATRSRARIGVANFTVTASVGLDSAIDMPISLAFSDDNGATWSKEFDLPLTDMSAQTLIWNALGSFAAPGRVFRITDYAGPVRLDGADVVLTLGTGADSGLDSDGQTHP